MTPPKCFFKRPQEYYEAQNPRQRMSQISSNKHMFSETLEFESCHSSVKSEPVITPLSPDLPDKIFLKSKTEILFDHPLDLSRKSNELRPLSDHNELIKHFNRFLYQNKLKSRMNYGGFYSKISNIELPPLLMPNNVPYLVSSAPNILMSPPPPSIASTVSPTEPTDSHILLASSADLGPHRRHHSSTPDSGHSDSLLDNSSETSSLCTTNSALKPGSALHKPPHSRLSHKRKVDGKVVRPFKLYKHHNDSQSVFEALDITEEDEMWLKNIVEHKNVDDIFQFLQDVMQNSMNETTDCFSDDILEKIKTKFGYIFINCNTSVSNPRMVRHPDMTPKELKTEEYWEKRRKNNEAAKRSREARRNKEESLTKRCDELQLENDQIRKEIERVKLQIDSVRRVDVAAN